MPFIPHTDDDVREMLETIGVPSIETLFDEIPASLRVGSLAEIPEGLNELEVLQLMAERARSWRECAVNKSICTNHNHIVFIGENRLLTILRNVTIR